MKLQCLLILFSVFLCFSPKAQFSFENVISENTADIPSTVIELDDGYLVCARGNELSIGGWRGIKLIKTDLIGNVVWRKFIGKPNYVYSPGESGSMLQTHNGGFIIGGYFSSVPQTSTKALLVRLDSNGDTLWIKKHGATFSYNYINQVRQTRDSGFVSFGNTDESDPQVDYYLIKTDSLGNKKWEKTYGNPGLYEGGLRIDLTSDGGFILGGQKGANNVDLANGYFIKTDSAGNIEWEKLYGTEGDDYIRYITNSKNGGYIIWGSADTMIMNNSEYGRSSFIAKLDSNGNQVWQTYLSKAKRHLIHQVRQTEDGSIVFIGEGVYQGVNEDAGWIGKLDADGNLLWERFHIYKEREFFGKQAKFRGDFQQTEDGGYIVAGIVWRQEDTTQSNVYNTMAWLVKLDSMGCLNGDCGIPVGVNEIPISGKNDVEIVVYPNPANEILYVENKSANQKIANIQILGLNGREIINTQNTSINTAQLAKGLYFVKMNFNSGTSEVRKVVVE